jgi:hypothetical protein
MSFTFKKVLQRRILKRIYLERLTEPVHLNLISLFVMAFGSLRAKIHYDLIVRQGFAYSILKCADQANQMGIKSVSIAEFGVASGAGLLNMAHIARKVTACTGVEFKVYGFDTGKGMPPARDYRDHPELYQEGDFPMNVEVLQAHLPSNAELIIGDAKDSVTDFLKNLSGESPLGFISVDVDYYYSAKEVLRILEDDDPTKYLPLSFVYLDDISLDHHNSRCGELLAVREHNEAFVLRPIEYHPFLENTRIFRRANWLKQIYFMHTLDHPHRNQVKTTAKKRSMSNPYLSYEGNRENFKV